jgi:hypothetical protein
VDGLKDRLFSCHCAIGIACYCGRAVQVQGGPKIMPGKFIKFNVLAESRKVLRGKSTKVSEASLLHALADSYAAEHGAKKSKG